MGVTYVTGVPGKDRFISEIEKYRKPGQTRRANVCAIFCEETRKYGIVGAIVQQLDGRIQISCIRLKDLITLHKENKIYVTNIRLAPEAVEIWTCDLSTRWVYLLYKDIKYMNLARIGALVAQKAKDTANDECLKYNVFR